MTAPLSAPGSIRRRAPSPILLVLIGIASVQLGAGVAKSLFDSVDPTALAWLRLVTSAVVLLAWAVAALTAAARWFKWE